MSATVAMSWTTRLLRAARLIANRSRNTPSAGAITKTMMSIAGTSATPHSCVSCQ